MSFSGNLRSINLADVFQNIAANSLTGTLRVKWRKSERYVRLEGGKITGFSMGVGKGLDILGHLLQRGYVEQKKADKMLARVKKSRKPITRLIVEAGLLDEDELFDAFSELVEEHMYELMQLKEADFEVDEGPAPARVFGADQQRMGLELLTGPLVMEGARRRDEWDRINNIIASDEDLFVMLDGWEELELDEFTASVAEWLDGQTSVGVLVSSFYAPRFEVLKAVSDIVHLSGARACTTEEIERMTKEAVAAGDAEGAIDLLRLALSRERNNHDLRTQYAQLLAEQGNAKEAAAEYAMMGYQLANEGELEEALNCYALAVELNPTDLPLQERRIDLLTEAEHSDELVTAALGLVDVFEKMGLADRARHLLMRFTEDAAMAGEYDLFAQLAHIESSVGNQSEAARIYVQIGERVLITDEAQALVYMRLGLDESPEDEALASRILDIESGRRRRRQVRRRFIALGVTVSILIGLVGYGGWYELRALHKVNAVLVDLVGPLDDERSAVSVSELQAVQEEYSWLPSASRAGRVIGRVVDLQLGVADVLIVSGEYDRAEQVLRRIEGLLKNDELLKSCRQHLHRLEVERNAYGILLRTEVHGDPSPEQLTVLSTMTDCVHLEFHLAHLPSLRNTAARRAQLKALAAIPSPRSFRLATNIYLFDTDSKSRELARAVLLSVADLTADMSEADRQGIYPLLEQAQGKPELGLRASEVLRLLQRGRKAEEAASTPQKPPN